MRQHNLLHLQHIVLLPDYGRHGRDLQSPGNPIHQVKYRPFKFLGEIVVITPGEKQTGPIILGIGRSLEPIHLASVSGIDDHKDA